MERTGAGQMNEAELGFELKNALARIEALEAALREIRLAPMRFDDGKRDTDYGQGILNGLNGAAEIARAALTPEQDK
jgi:hypothetical protein